VAELKLLFSVTAKDFEMQTFSVGGCGGSGKDTSNSGVRLTHRASGAVGEGRETRSNTQNRRAAFRHLIETPKFKAWHAAECARLMGESPASEEQVRSEAAFGVSKIRTYNTKQNRVTDHRVNKTYSLPDVMDGKLDPIIRDLAHLYVRI
jgi:protein subunit release factor A